MALPMRGSRDRPQDMLPSILAAEARAGQAENHGEHGQMARVGGEFAYRQEMRFTGPRLIQGT